uniref:Uncharacterized protein n=1 Tax=Candidatus Enterococcus clewellii TaxID=1834193 RepID=A0A242KE11_9ENTE|nr:hypothetical protein [Enterococcus sp. 9E7_DIV0242]OTP19028.1 hypothetical protein A5888_000842 [Enterococcus sp. 9E7_DIV0242]
MIVTEPIKVFQLEFVEPLVKSLIQELDEAFRQEKNELIVYLEKKLQPFFTDLQEQQRVGQASPTSFFVFSWLRAPYLFDERLCYEIHSYGKQWYYSPKQAESVIQFDWLSPYLKAFKSRLEEEINACQNPHLQKQTNYFLSSYYDVFHQYFIALLRYLFRERGKQLFEGIVTGKSLYVYAGEYKDASERIMEWQEEGLSQTVVDYF